MPAARSQGKINKYIALPYYINRCLTQKEYQHGRVAAVLWFCWKQGLFKFQKRGFDLQGPGNLSITYKKTSFLKQMFDLSFQMILIKDLQNQNTDEDVINDNPRLPSILPR